MSRPGLAFGIVILAACNGDDTTPADTDTDGGDDQVPPQGYAEIDPWLDAGEYEDWSCEAAPHAAAVPSPHSFNRICSNDLLSGHTTGEYPVGAASVKELWDETQTNVVGYAVQTKVSAGTGPETWYWYEQVPPGTVITGVTIDANGVVADGLGDEGQAATICVGCHVSAPNDHVWVQVP